MKSRDGSSSARNRGALLRLAAGALLIVAKLTSVAVNPSSLKTGLFPQLLVLVVALGLLRCGWRARGGEEARPGWRSLLLVILGLVMAGFVFTIAWADFHLARRSHPGVYDDPHKVWATRGLVTDGSDGGPVRKRNSIESISHAFERGAKGTEVDVRYDPGMDVFVVSHSKRYEKRNGSLLTLEALLDAVGDRGWFWLDWKSQRDLSAEENRAALARLNELVGQGDLRKRVYVEGEAPHVLATVRRAGFLTIYDCRPRCETELLGRLLGPVLVDAYKAVFHFGGFTVMCAPGGSPTEPVYGPRTRLALRNIPVFLYHLPDDPEYLRSLVALDDVRVVIIRQDIDRFDIVAGSNSE